MKINIWKKTLLILALIATVMVSLLTFIGQRFIVEDNTSDELKRNLSQASYTLNDSLEHLVIFAKSIEFNLQHHHYGDLGNFLSEQLDEYENEKPDIIFLVDRKGKLIWSRNNIKLTDVPYKDLEIVKKGLKGQEISGYEIIPESIIKAEGLLSKTKVNIVTEIGNEKNKPSINKGLFQVVGKPVLNEKNQFTAVLIVGKLLNNNDSLIWEISQSAGAAASILSDGVRIATTFNKKVNKNIKGTLLESNIYNVTFREGKEYFGSSKINDINVVAAYRPLRDLENRIVAVLGITVNEEPILASQRKYQIQLYVLVTIVGVLIIFLIWWLYTSVVKGIWTLVKGVKQIANGQYSVRVFLDKNNNWKIKKCKYSNTNVGTQDHTCVFDNREVNNDLIKNMCPSCNLDDSNLTNEVHYLANMFNYMALVLEERENKLKETNEELEVKNIELTSQQEELQAQQEELEAQQEELISQQTQLMNLNEQLAATIDELDDIQDIVYSLALAIEAKDKYTRGHSERVANYAVKLGTHIGLTDNELQLLLSAGTVHDIGKIGISEAILQKPGSLTKEEFDRIKEHPIIGEKICHSLKSAYDLLPIIRHHHERYNGEGYPDGLKGKDIPLFARIMSIADAYDAMTSDRPYRKGMTSEEAIKVLMDEAGIMWDPELIAQFVQVIKKK